jgi:hypothetical protein
MQNILIVTLALATFCPAIQARQQETASATQTLATQQPTVEKRHSYYFGMTLDVAERPAGKTLRIQSVVPGSPAKLAGLEVGDEIIAVNGNRILKPGCDEKQIADFLNNAVWQHRFSGTLSYSSDGRAGFPAIRRAQPLDIAYMYVRNVRNGQPVSITVQPSILATERLSEISKEPLGHSDATDVWMEQFYGASRPTGHTNDRAELEARARAGARAYSSKDAYADISAGKLVILGPPLPNPPWWNKYSSLLAARGITQVVVYREDARMTQGDLAYNAVMQTEISRRFGAGVLAQLLAEAKGQ